MYRWMIIKWSACPRTAGQHNQFRWDFLLNCSWTSPPLEPCQKQRGPSPSSPPPKHQIDRRVLWVWRFRPKLLFRPKKKKKVVWLSSTARPYFWKTGKKFLLYKSIPRLIFGIPKSFFFSFFFLEFSGFKFTVLKFCYQFVCIWKLV